MESPLKNNKKHYPALKQLSNLYNIPQSTILNHATKNQWTQKRKEAKNQMSMDILDKEISVKNVDGGERSRVERLDLFV